VDLLGAVFDLVINLFPPYLNFVRRFNPELYSPVVVAEYGYFDIVIDDNGFVLTSGEYEHWFLRPWFKGTMPGSINTRYPQKLTGFVGFGLHTLGKGSFRTIADACESSMRGR
jgi:hypothetical protein